jgi:hypothetical protein
MTVSRKTNRPRGLRKPYASVLSLVDRDGPIRSLTIDHRGVGPRLWKHLHPDSRLVTDSAPHYKGRALWHESVDHSKFEWARGSVHTNTLEGFFSVFKRGIIGVYQHVDAKHFDRYLAEFDFRMNTRAKLGINDSQRTDIALQGVKGKRLTYETTQEGTQARSA